MITKKYELVQTDDGSATLYVPEMDEHYHSFKGALRESMHVFIKTGLEEVGKNKSVISILEVGFGTGLNALLSLKYVLDQPEKRINYSAIEKYPLEISLIESLNYTSDANNTLQELFLDIHRVGWETESVISDKFKLFKIYKDLLTVESLPQADLVYFDAFGPDKQPEMWTMGVFKKLYHCMTFDAVLVTYSAKGEVRRRLQKAGFKVERLPGPPGKREMLRAIK